MAPSTQPVLRRERVGTGEDIDSDRGEEAHPDFVAALVKIWISNVEDVY